MGIVLSLRSFDREQQKEFHVPIVIKDSGNPAISGTSTLTVIIGDVNDNKMQPGSKEIFAYNYMVILADPCRSLPILTDPYRSLPILSHSHSVTCTKCCNVGCFLAQGQSPDTEVGRVYVYDLDDWDLPDKKFYWESKEHPNFSLHQDTGMLTMRHGTRDGT